MWAKKGRRANENDRIEWDRERRKERASEQASRWIEAKLQIKCSSEEASRVCILRVCFAHSHTQRIEYMYSCKHMYVYMKCNVQKKGAHCLCCAHTIQTWHKNDKFPVCTVYIQYTWPKYISNPHIGTRYNSAHRTHNHCVLNPYTLMLSHLCAQIYRQIWM